MDAVMYLKERTRMTQECRVTCMECPIGRGNSGRDVSCGQLEHNYPKEAIAIVEKWGKEHPRKTYLDDFLEKFPEAKCAGGVPPVCAKQLGYIVDCSEYDDCEQCWNAPVEE